MGDIISASQEATKMFVPTISVPCNTSDPQYSLVGQYCGLAPFGR
jgi:hypothetical protein